MQGSTRTQVDQRLELEWSIRDVRQTVTPCNFVQMHEHLVKRRCVPLAQAMRGPSSEGHVGKARPLGFVLGRETLR